MQPSDSNQTPRAHFLEPLTMRPFSKNSNFFLVLILFVLSKHGTTVDVPNGYHGQERDALLVFKSGFQNSIIYRNWTGLMCFKDVPPYWVGIECSGGRVTGIRLDYLGLTGEFPSDDVIYNLTQLSVLSLKGNSIYGKIMDFSNNKELVEIDLSNNSFVGPIPSSLVTLNSLASLQLQYNNLSGNIPFFNQSSLKLVNLSYNNLSGPIPSTPILQSKNVSSYFDNPNLCGPPTHLSCKSQNDQTSNTNDDGVHSSKSFLRSRLLVILLIVSIVFFAILVLVIIVYFRRYKNLKKQLKPKYNLHGDREVKEEKETEPAIEKVIVREDHEKKGQLVFLNGERNLEVDDLLKAKAAGLGQGNFGNCYKVMLDEGMTLVVKRLRDLKPMSKEEYIKQVKIIADQKHPNLLPLLGYYFSKEEKLLLHKFASNGNAFTRLHSGKGSPTRTPFRWSSRLSVATAVARALEYLHLNTKASNTAPHGNLKLSNILFDENDAIFLTDYGLASIMATTVTVQRMIAYRSPEYRANKKVSKKSDVWSYGCLLLELLTGKVSSDSAPPGVSTGVDICNWVHRAVREEWTGEIFDVEIAVQRSANHAMVRLLQIAIRCCERLPEKRPDMSEVVGEVEKIVAVNDSGSDSDPAVSGDRSLSATDDSISGILSLISGEIHK